ncbi:hypothetical protein ACP70R_031724 [Stipagrostis hirtigluma subsp. patula]
MATKAVIIVLAFAMLIVIAFARRTPPLVQKEQIMKHCMEVIKKNPPYGAPSASCINALTNCDLAAVCGVINEEDEEKISVERLLEIARQFGRSLTPGAKCGPSLAVAMGPTDWIGAPQHPNVQGPATIAALMDDDVNPHELCGNTYNLTVKIKEICGVSPGGICHAGIVRKSLEPYGDVYSGDELVGIAAEELVAAIGGVRGVVPEQIARLCGHQYEFEVSVSRGGLQRIKPSFKVDAIRGAVVPTEPAAVIEIAGPGPSNAGADAASDSGQSASAAHISAAATSPKDVLEPSAKHGALLGHETKDKRPSDLTGEETSTLDDSDNDPVSDLSRFLQTPEKVSHRKEASGGIVA